MDQPQLWNAGPVRSGVSRGIPGATRQSNRSQACKSPGCPEPRLYRHQYCAEHATMIGYELRKGWKGPVKEQVCPGCGRSFILRKRVVYNAQATTWLEFCADCHDKSCLSRAQLRAHQVPPDLMRTWLSAGRGELTCAICARPFTAARRPVVDHDHGHCGGLHRSCGECVRGLLCNDCNCKVGQIESLRRQSMLDAVLAYLDRVVK